MKKTLILIVTFGFVASFVAPVYAAVPKSIDKLKHGVVDIVKSPLELIDQTKKEVNGADYKAVGLLKGLIKSPFHIAMKAGKGAVDVATFPITE